MSKSTVNRIIKDAEALRKQRSSGTAQTTTGRQNAAAILHNAEMERQKRQNVAANLDYARKETMKKFSRGEFTVQDLPATKRIMTGLYNDVDKKLNSQIENELHIINDQGREKDSPEVLRAQETLTDLYKKKQENDKKLSEIPKPLFGNNKNNRFEPKLEYSPETNDYIRRVQGLNAGLAERMTQKQEIPLVWSKQLRDFQHMINTPESTDSEDYVKWLEEGRRIGQYGDRELNAMLRGVGQADPAKVYAGMDDKEKSSWFNLKDQDMLSWNNAMDWLAEHPEGADADALRAKRQHYHDELADRYYNEDEFWQDEREAARNRLANLNGKWLSYTPEGERMPVNIMGRKGNYDTPEQMARMDEMLYDAVMGQGAYQNEISGYEGSTFRDQHMRTLNERISRAWDAYENANPYMEGSRDELFDILTGRDAAHDAERVNTLESERRYLQDQITELDGKLSYYDQRNKYLEGYKQWNTANDSADDTQYDKGKYNPYDYRFSLADKGSNNVDDIYSFIIGGNERRNYIEATSAGRGGATGNISKEYKGAMLLMPEEINIFKNMYEAGQKEEASAFLDGLQFAINQRYLPFEEIRTREEARAFPILNSIFAQGANVVNTVMGAANAIGSGLEAAQGITNADEMGNDPASNAYAPVRYATTVQDEVASMLGPDAGKLYLTTMNTMRNVINGVLLTKMGIPAGALSTATLATFGTQIYQEKMYEHLQENRDFERANALSILDTALEVGEELLPIETMFATAGANVFIRVIANMLAEGGEEFAGATAGEVLRGMITGRYAWEKRKDEIFNEGGYTDKDGNWIEIGKGDEGLAEAHKQAMREWGEQIISNTVSGAFGGAMGATYGAAQNYSVNRKTGIQVNSKEGGFDTLLEAARGMDPESQTKKIADELYQKKQKGKNISNYQTGKLARIMYAESGERIQGIIKGAMTRQVEAELKEEGASPEYAEKAAPAIAEAVTTGKQPRKADIRIIAKEDAGLILMESYMTGDRDAKESIKKAGGEAAIKAREAVRDVLGEKPAKVGPNKGDTARLRQFAPIAKQDELDNATGPRHDNGLDAVVGGQIVTIKGRSGDNYIVIDENNEEHTVSKNEVHAADERLGLVMEYADRNRHIIDDATFQEIAFGLKDNKDMDLDEYLEQSTRAYIEYMTGGEVQNSKLADTTLNSLKEHAARMNDVLHEKGLVKPGKQQKVTPGKGTVTYNGIKAGTDEWQAMVKKAGPIKARELQLVAEIGVRLGNQFEIVEREDLPDSFGWEDRETGKIYINLAAKSSEDSRRNRSVTTIMAHELTHWLKQNSPEMYKELAQFVYKGLRESNENIVDSVYKKIGNEQAAVDRTISIADALDEIVADACDQVLTNEQTIRQLENESPNLYQKIKTFVRNFIDTVMGYTRNSKGEVNTDTSRASYQIRQLGQEFENELVRKWLNTRAEALGRQEGNPETAEAQEGTGEVRMSTREKGIKKGSLAAMTDEQASVDTSETTAGSSTSNKIISSYEKYVNRKKAAKLSEEEARMDEEYMRAIRDGDIKKQQQMLMEKLSNTKGIYPFMAPHMHRGNYAKIAKLIKTGDEESIKTAAKDMAVYVPDNAVLVPMPNSSGKVTETTDTMLLAKEISRITGKPVINAIEGAKRESRFKDKKKGKTGVKADQMGFHQIAEIPNGELPMIIDNVVAVGETAKAAIDAIKGSFVLSFTKGQTDNVIDGLKGAFATKDEKGNYIPYSKRFDTSINNWRYSTREQDQEYMDAVNSGNMEKAQQMVDQASEAAGYSIRGDHGTVSKYFTIFDRKYGNAEGDWGKGFYFTNNKDDVETNYASEEGADLTAKIELLAEQMEWMDDYAEMDYDERMEAARKQLAGGEPRVIHGALRMTNPVIVGGPEETFFDYNEEYDEENDEYGEPEGSLIDFIEALNDVLSEYEYANVDTSSLYTEGMDYGGLRASDLEKLAKELVMDVTDEEGKLAGNEIVREAFERAGFDGIVDNTVARKFGSRSGRRNAMVGVDTGTTHYIVFHPEQIKQTDPATYDDAGKLIPLSERFNENKKDIRYSTREKNDRNIVNGEEKRYNGNNEYGGIENDESRAGKIRERVKRNSRRSTSWALTGKAAVSIIRGDYAGIVAKGKTGYELFRTALNGSAIKSKKGEPVIWYHGTDRKFNQFKEQKNTNYSGTSGFYFTSSSRIAGFYASRNGNEEAIYPISVYAKAPITFNAKELHNNYRVQNEALKVIKVAHNVAKSGKLGKNFYKTLNGMVNALVSKNVISNDTAGKIVDAFVSNKDIDSVIIKGATWDNGEINDQIIVFDDENIIPATADIWEEMTKEESKYNYSTREADLEVNRWMLGLSESSLRTEQERMLWKQYKEVNGSWELTKRFIRELNDRLKGLEAKENKTAKDTFDIQNLQKQIEKWEKKRDEYEEQILKVTADEGYAAIMYRERNKMENLLNGRTEDEVRAAIDAIQAEMDTVEREMAERNAKLKELAERENVKIIRNQLNSAGLRRIAAKLKADLGSELQNKEIENRLALLALKMKQGKVDSSEIMELADMLVGSMRPAYDDYVLSELRGMTIALNSSEQETLKNRGMTVRDLQRELTGTGIRVTAGGPNTIDKNWDELTATFPQLDREANPGDMLYGPDADHKGLMDLVEDAIRQQKAMGPDSDQVAAMVLEAASDLVPEVLTDEKSMKLIRESMEFIAEINQGTEALDNINALFDRLKKKNAHAKATLGTLENKIIDAIEYTNELAKQHDVTAWKRERQLLVERLRSEHTQKLLEEQTKYREKIERYKKAQELTADNQAARREIHMNINRMRRLLVNETDSKNIPEHMKSLAREMVGMVLKSDQLYDRKITAIKPEDRRDALRMIEAWNDRDGKFTLNDLQQIPDEEVQEVIENALADIEEGIESYTAPAGKNLIENLSNYKKALVQIQDAVEKITNIIEAEQTAVIDGQKRKVSHLAYGVVADLDKSKRKGEWTGFGSKALTAAQRSVIYGNTTPVYFIKNLRNRGMDVLWNGFESAENRKGLLAEAARKHMQALAEKYNYASWQHDKNIDVILNGVKVPMKLENIMALYATWTREQQMGPEVSQHMAQGGVYIEDEQENKGTPHREKKTQRARRVKAEDIERIEAMLTQEQKDYIRDVAEYLSKDMSELGNEASMAMYGIKKYNEKYYFPMKVWDGVKSARSDKGISGTQENRIAHQGWSKRRKHLARNALIIGKFTDTAVKHIDEMTNYVTFAPVIEGLNKVLNWQEEQLDEEEVVNRRNLRVMFQEAYGKEALRYLEDWMKDLQGGVTQDQRKTLRDRLISMFKKNAVAGSLSVTLQQPLSYIRAAMLINPKYLAGALSPQYWKGSYQEMMDHSGVAVIKKMGRFDMNFGQSTRDWITPKTGKTVYEKFSDALTKAPEIADTMTWTRMWSAVKMEQHAQHPDMDIKSDDFLNLVGKRFNEVMRRTQVYDSTLTKSSNMRSQALSMKLITSFMAEPTLTLNVLADAVMNVKEKGGKSTLAKAGATYLLSAVLQAAVKGFMGAGRSPDEKKTAAENLLNKILNNLLSEANPASLVPGYSDLVEVLKNGELKDDALGVLGKLKSIYTTAQNMLNPDKSKGPWRDVEDTMGQFVQLFSNIPLKNLMRDLRAMYNWATGRKFADRDTSGAVLKYQAEETLNNGDNLLGIINSWLGDAGYKSNNKAYYSRMYNAMAGGNQAEAEGIREYLELAKGQDSKKVQAGLRTAAREDDSKTPAEVSQWMIDNDLLDGTSTITTQYKKGEITREDAEKLYKAADPKMKDNDVFWKLDQLDYQKETGETETGYYYRLRDAITKNKAEEIKAAVKTLLEHGITKEKIKDKLSDWKAEYLAGDSAKKVQIRDAITKAYKAAGYTADDANKTIERWNKEAKKTEPEKKEAKDTTGRWGRGNIDLNNRKVVENDDGTISTELSITVGYDNDVFLIPTVIDGKIVSDEEAIRHFEQTGQYLGKFKNEKEAQEYAEKLHNRQDWYYNQ